MNCPKCSKVIGSGDVFCKNCGSKFIFTMTEAGVTVKVADNGKLNNVDQVTNSNQQQPNNNIMNNEIDDFDLIDAYMGKNSNNLKKGFSVCTLLLGPMYVFYRKMYGLGFLWILANILISTFLPDYSILSLVINIIMAFAFKKMYLNFVIKKVNQIKIRYLRNNNDTLIYICSKKGGTTIVPIIVIVVAYLLMSFLATKVILDIINDSKNSADKIKQQLEQQQQQLEQRQQQLEQQKQQLEQYH